MTKFEFLGDLSRLIADLPPEEVEQAMEYYEDYFADAGPEKEQEIIKDFISPAYIAEQLREASHERQKAAAQASFREEEQRANAAAAAAAAEKPAVFSRKLAAQAQKGGSQPQAAPTGQAAQTQMSSGTAQTVAPVQPTPQAAPTPQPQAAAPQAAFTQQAPTAAAQQPQAAPTQQVPPAGAQPQTAAPRQAQTTGVPQPGAPAAAPQPEKKSSAMRNSIFQEDSEEDKEKAEKELELRNRTKIDIKSINATTSKVDKKQAREAAKRSAAEEKALNAERYSSSKKMVIGIVLLITCPIWLAVVGVILGLFAAGAGLAVGCIAGGIGCLIGSVVSLLLTVLALINAQIPTSVFALGCVFFLFAAGIGLCYGSFKLITRGIPNAYFSAQALFTSVKSKLSRLALK